MKSLKLFRILPLIASTALLLTCFEASAAGYKLADKVGASIAKFRDDIVDIKKAVDATMVSLDQIVVTAPVDPRKAFKEFDKNVPKIDSAAKTAKKHSEDMKAKGQAYFQQWAQEMTNVNSAEIRQLAEERKAKLQTSFDNIKNTTEPAREQFVAWLDHLKDLQKFLSQDITLSGVEAAKEPIAKAKTEGLAVQQSLEKVISELNTVVATITPAKLKK
jgi:hypothetical protein